MSVPAVSIEKLNGNNWATWRLGMYNALVVQGLAHCLEPFQQIPNEPQAQAAARYGQYERDCFKVRALMLMAMEGHQAIECDASYGAPCEMWAGLFNVWQSTSRASYLQMINDLTTLQMMPRESINNYIGRVTALRTRLRFAGQDKAEEEICIYLLKGLSPAYNTIRTILTHSAQAGGLTLQSIRPVLLNAEAEIPQSRERGYWTAGRNDNNGGRNNQRNGRGQQHDGTEQRTCHNCKKKGHLRRDCPELKASSNDKSVPRRSGGNNRPPSSGKTLAFYANDASAPTVNVALFTNIEQSCDMIHDSGATSHVSNRLDNFETY
jgi:hypothetical protein